jgi:DNA-binding transcriptional MerR regulator
VNNDHHSGQRDGYLSLGRFAQAVQLSRKALRIYNQLGILVPDYVDPESGYRYYSTAQFEKARFIRLLRAMEMPLADIRCVLATTTPDEAIELVLDCQRAFEKKTDQVRQASHKFLAYLRKEYITISINVSAKRFPVCQAVSIKKNITVPAFHEFIPNALSQLRAFVKETGANIIGDPICFYYGPVLSVMMVRLKSAFRYKGMLFLLEIFLSVRFEHIMEQLGELHLNKAGSQPF